MTTLDHNSRMNWVEKLLIRPRKLLHKLFSGNQPFLIKSFASASVCATLEMTNSSIVTGLLSGSAIVLPHLITLSALTSTFGGIVRPICFAALRLITNSNFVGCSTGRSAGLAPFKILSTYVPARRSKSSMFTP